MNRAPLAEAVSAEAPFYIEREIVIGASGRYSLFLAFDRRDATFDRLRSIVGGAYGQKIEVNGVLRDAGEPAGLPIPVGWTLESLDGVVVAGTRSDVLGANSFSEAEIGSLLYAGNLATGRYKFTASLVSGIREFSGVRGQLRLEPDPKFQ